jgi:diguanylate cyclase (GGDEF)-like protein
LINRLSLLLIDLDKFKQVNDLHGHAAGDEVLQAVASVIRALTAKKGQPYRYGGDEIIVLLPNHSAAEAMTLAERILQRVERLSFERYPEALTVSIGVASYPKPTAQLTQLLDDADKAMYAAKDKGGNTARSAETKGHGPGLSGEGTVRLVRSDVASRVEAVELWMTLQQSNDRAYGILFENDNDEDVTIEGVALRTGTLFLCRYAKPKEPGDWVVPAHSRKHISGEFASDPIHTLRTKDPHLPAGTVIEIDVVVRARILGRLRTLSHTILATADYGGRRITQFSL